MTKHETLLSFFKSNARKSIFQRYLQLIARSSVQIFIDATYKRSTTACPIQRSLPHKKPYLNENKVGFRAAVAVLVGIRIGADPFSVAEGGHHGEEPRRVASHPVAVAPPVQIPAEGCRFAEHTDCVTWE